MKADLKTLNISIFTQDYQYLENLVSHNLNLYRHVKASTVEEAISLWPEDIHAISFLPRNQKEIHDALIQVSTELKHHRQNCRVCHPTKKQEIPPQDWSEIFQQGGEHIWTHL